MTLLNLLKKDENARKIFGERELKIIEKQLLGVNLTQSEKNRLSRDIRKKFEFIRKVSGFESEFDLKKGAKINKIIDEAKEIILNDILSKRIKRIILYGSAVENKLSLRSDIDLAVELNKTTLNERTAFRKRILGKVNNRIDLQIYNNLPEKIKKDINSKGKVIYNENK